MRTLVVATEYPWPLNSGSRLRLANTVEGLSRCGPTELFSAVSRDRKDLPHHRRRMHPIALSASPSTIARRARSTWPLPGPAHHPLRDALSGRGE